MRSTRAIIAGAAVVAASIPVQGRAQTPSFTPAPVPSASTPEVRLAPPAPRLYGGLEYLLWSVKDAPLAVPLLSTGPFTEPDRGGFLKDSNATILYGAPQAPAEGGKDTQSFPLFSGARLTLGSWIDDAHTYAVEGSGFLLQQKDARYDSRSDFMGNPGQRIPLFNSETYSSGGVGMAVTPQEDGVPVSLPGELTGDASFRSSLDFWGLGATGVANIYRDSNLEVSELGGFRYLNLTEAFSLNMHITGLPNTLYAGQSGWLADNFKTENEFFGGTLGIRGRYSYGPVWAQATTTLGIGLSHESEAISGGFQDYNVPGVTGAPGVVNGLIPVKEGPNGVFAQPSNEGHRSTNKFAIVPEVDLKLGYDITPAVQLTVGYNFIYYSSVLRPTDQIDRSFSKGLPFGQDPTSTNGPVAKMQTTDFYAQGLTVGVGFKF